MTTTPPTFKRFNVYNSISIFSGLPLQVECIAGYDDHFLIGTNKGHLLIYKITLNVPVEINLTHSNKYFSRKPILQLEVIPEYKILVSLTVDNGITVHDMSQFNCPTISAIDRTKGAHLFVLDIVRQVSLTGDRSITVRMCALVGKKLQLFYWKNREFKELREVDFSVPDMPRAISWCKETLCLAIKTEYCLLSLQNGNQEELFNTSKQGDPIITKIISSMQADSFALVQDKKSILISLDRSREMQSVAWTDVPTALVYDEPYLVAIIAGRGVEIRTITPKILVDSFPFPGAKLLSITKRGLIYVASNNSIWCLKSTPVDAQIESFLVQNQFELALNIASIWDELPEERKRQMDHIQKLYAFHLFCNKNYEESMNIFSKLETDVCHVIGLFPDLLPPEFRNKLEYPGETPELSGIDLENGLSALAQFLIQSRRTVMGDPKSKNQTVANTGSLDGSATIRSKKQLLQIIDTTLLKCYLQTNESLVASLLRLKENYCHLEETERALRRHGKLNELIIMYQSRELHRKALELLHKQNNLDRIIHYLQNLGKDQMDLILEFAKPILQVNNMEGLKIFIEDMQEVEALPRARVYDFLLNNFKGQLVILYLDHVITAWNEKNALFHNALINQYREMVLSETNVVIKEEYRNKLLQFLKSSTFYTPEHVLVHFPYDDMFEERALLLEKLGRHEQALSIYTTILKDMNKAQEYCRKVYEKNDPSRREVFTILMRMLLNPPTSFMPGVVLDPEDESKEPDLRSAVKLLHDFAPFIEPYRALKCLPDDIEVQEIQNFLKTSVQNHFSEKRKLLIQKGLIKSEHLRATTEKIACESDAFIVSDSIVCDVCRKRFSNQSAFARYPDGSIVHFSCQERE